MNVTHPQHGTHIEIAKAITRGEYGDPFSILGMHADGPEGTMVVRVFFPDADQIDVFDKKSGREVATLERLLPMGFFVGLLGRHKQRFAYRLQVHIRGEVLTLEDPYQFGTLLDDSEVQAIIKGTFWRSYERLGAHPITLDGVSGVSFAVWAPNASRVSVVGDFNSWDGRRHVMRLRHRCCVWEIFLPGLVPGDKYMYEIKDRLGVKLPLKADPYGFYAEQAPHRASIVAKIDDFTWDDKEWMKNRPQRMAKTAPISIYEVHLGSWRRVPEEGDRYLTYLELADQLVPYVKQMGFSHVEFMPVNEHPFFGSWGYQPVGLYAPTSRFGSPGDFKILVERFHQEGIGVILDWVPAHFPSDKHGLAFFDGTHLYEHADPRRGIHPDWKTLIFNYRRNEVTNYIISNALYWLDRFHIDGLRVDAVASMLFLSYSRQPGEWVPNDLGGDTDLDAIYLLRKMNDMVHSEYEGAITIAEESTAWPGVTAPTGLAGLGFTYKWNMGWMNDTLRYMARDPIYRRYHHHEMTFSMAYAYDESFVLPLSHDEVVHLKRSLLSKMPGDQWRQFANLRAYYAFMWTHPGKKLLFMGNEIAQIGEWNYERSLDWHLLDSPLHTGLQQTIRDLNLIYHKYPALSELDYQPDGFRWISADLEENSLYYFMRFDRSGQMLVVLVNLTPIPRYDSWVGVARPGSYKTIFNSDQSQYGGSGVEPLGEGCQAIALEEPSHGQPYHIVLTLPPLATIILELEV